jgi:hypothetical protein
MANSGNSGKVFYRIRSPSPTAVAPGAAATDGWLSLSHRGVRGYSCSYSMWGNTSRHAHSALKPVLKSLKSTRLTLRCPSSTNVRGIPFFLSLAPCIVPPRPLQSHAVGSTQHRTAVLKFIMRSCVVIGTSIVVTCGTSRHQCYSCALRVLFLIPHAAGVVGVVGSLRLHGSAGVIIS